MTTTDIFNKFKLVREIESRINRNLFRMTGALTILIMMLGTIEFFSRGRFFLANMSLLYLGLLVIYSFHKEMIRWLGKRKVERQGEYFVYGWIGLTTFLYLINFFSGGYFIRSAAGEPLDSLKGLSLISLEVLGIFIVTRSLKIFKIFLEKKGANNKSQ